MDLLRLGNESFFVNSLPSQVNVLNVPFSTNILLCKSAKESMLMLFKQKKYLMCLFEFVGHGIYKVLSKLTGLNTKIFKWKIISFVIPQIESNYDVAIAYNYDYPIHFIIDKVKAKKKIGWIHGNYKLTKSIAMLDKIYFNKLDKIVTVSETCLDILNNVFPKYSHKLVIIENILSPNVINLLSNQFKEGLNKKENEINIVTVARLSSEKGIDMAIKALSLLVKEGHNIKWTVIGEGFERNNLEQLIKTYDLEERFDLIGEKTNPYSYIRQADIYVQPSITEGKSIAIEEAKILGKPIVVTNYSTVNDQIKDSQNGLIVSINPNGLFDGINKLLNSPKMRSDFSNELLKDIQGNENEVLKFYEIIN